MKANLTWLCLFVVACSNDTLQTNPDLFEAQQHQEDEAFTGFADEPTNAAPPVAFVWKSSSEVDYVPNVLDYQPRLAQGGLSLANPANDFTASVTASGVQLLSNSDSWEDPRWSLTVNTIAVDGIAPNAQAPVVGGCSDWDQKDILGNCVYRTEQDLGGGVSTWWQNSVEGLQQGWTVSERLSDSDLFSLEVEISGLQAIVAPSGQWADLQYAGQTQLTYGGLKAWDSKGQNLSIEMVATARGLELQVDVSAAEFPIQIDPMLTDPSWTMYGSSSQMLSYSGGTTTYGTINQIGQDIIGLGDINGDGFDDVAITGGTVGIYLGTSDGLSSVMHAVRSAISMRLAAGDFNGDGYGDFSYESDAGIAVSFGSATGFQTFDDDALILGFTAVSSAGDFTNNGQDELVLSNENAPAEVYSFDGTSFNSIYEINFTTAADSGSYTVTDTGSDTGSYTDTGTGTGGSSSSGTANVRNGRMYVDPAGDVNGDGFDDIIIRARVSYEIDTSSLVFGRDDGSYSITYADWYLDNGYGHWGTGEYQELGFNASSAGDVNADGYDDIVIYHANGSSTEPLSSSSSSSSYWNQGYQAGVLSLYLGGPDGPSQTPNWTHEGTVYDHFGKASAALGDVNGDGYDDLAVGSDYDDNPTGQKIGTASIFLGNSIGLAASPSWLVYSPIPDSYSGYSSNYFDSFGWQVAAVGDVNNDGFTDMMVGRPYDSLGGTAFLYLGTSVGDDLDGDGYPTPIDCDDTNDLVHPHAEEVIDAIDNDCNHMIDDLYEECEPWLIVGDPSTLYRLDQSFEPVQLASTGITHVPGLSAIGMSKSYGLVGIDPSGTITYDAQTISPSTMVVSGVTVPAGPYHAGDVYGDTYFVRVGSGDQILKVDLNTGEGTLVNVPEVLRVADFVATSAFDNAGTLIGFDHFRDEYVQIAITGTSAEVTVLNVTGQMPWAPVGSMWTEPNGNIRGYHNQRNIFELDLGSFTSARVHSANKLQSHDGASCDAGPLPEVYCEGMVNANDQLFYIEAGVVTPGKMNKNLPYRALATRGGDGHAMSVNNELLIVKNGGGLVNKGVPTHKVTDAPLVGAKFGAAGKFFDPVSSHPTMVLRRGTVSQRDMLYFVDTIDNTWTEMVLSQPIQGGDLVVYNDKGYLFDHGLGEMLTVDLESGAVLPVTTTGTLPTHIITSMWTVSNTIYMVDKLGEVFTFEPLTGAVAWSFSAPELAGAADGAQCVAGTFGE